MCWTSFSTNYGQTLNLNLPYTYKQFYISLMSNRIPNDWTTGLANTPACKNINLSQVQCNCRAYPGCSDWNFAWLVCIGI